MSHKRTFSYPPPHPPLYEFKKGRDTSACMCVHLEEEHVRKRIATCATTKPFQQPKQWKTVRFNHFFWCFAVLPLWSAESYICKWVYKFIFREWETGTKEQLWDFLLGGIQPMCTFVCNENESPNTKDARHWDVNVRHSFNCQPAIVWNKRVSLELYLEQHEWQFPPSLFLCEDSQMSKPTYRLYIAFSLYQHMHAY